MGKHSSAGGREAIIAGAAQAIDREGVEAFSLKTLCAELGFSASLVNYHFASRGGLLSSVIARALDDLRLHIGEPFPDTPPDVALSDALSGATGWATEHRGLLAAMLLRFSDNFSVEVPESIRFDLHRAWRDLEMQCSRIAAQLNDEAEAERGLHLLWVLLGSMAWLTFPTLGDGSHELSKSRLPMSPDALVLVLQTTLGVSAGEFNVDCPPKDLTDTTSAGATRDRLIDATITLLQSKNGDSVSARSICTAAKCTPSLVTYHFASFELLVAEAATKIFVNGACRADEISRSSLPIDERLTTWLWTVTRSASGSLALPVALGSTTHRERLKKLGADGLESDLRNAWQTVIGSTAHLASATLQIDQSGWNGNLETFQPNHDIISTMSTIGLTGLGAALWMCSADTYRSTEEIESILARAIPVATLGIVALADNARSYR